MRIAVSKPKKGYSDVRKAMLHSMLSNTGQKSLPGLMYFNFSLNLRGRMVSFSMSRLLSSIRVMEAVM